MTVKGRLIVLSGPSGVGKNTVARELFAQRKNLRFSVSATTRAPRKGEADGQDYFFVSAEVFRKMVARDEFLEFAEVHGAFYGTPRAPVEQQLKAGFDVLLDIDSQGGFKVFESGLPYVSIFLLPPGLQALRGRLAARSSETEATYNLRLRNAGREIAAAERYQYSVVNDDLAACARAVLSIIDQAPDAWKHRSENSMDLLARLKEEFSAC